MKTDPPESAPKKPRRSWLVLCSGGWTKPVSEQWAAESVAKLHKKLGSTGTDHVVSIERTR